MRSKPIAPIRKRGTMFSIHKGYCLEAIRARGPDQWIVRITRLDGKNITASRHWTSPSWDTPAATLPDYAMRLAKAAIDTGLVAFA